MKNVEIWMEIRPRRCDPKLLRHGGVTGTSSNRFLRDYAKKMAAFVLFPDTFHKEALANIARTDVLTSRSV